MFDALLSREDPEPASRRRTKNILLVDDSESVRVATRLVIESCTNFRVCGEASHGVEAINKAQSLNPDVVIMDLAMPEMNGVEAANLLKKRIPEVQIVLFTLYADKVNAPLSEAFGVTTVVSKNDGFEPLVHCLNGLLGPA
jgi:two-component system vancomycin resistance associated response regulator VraR